MIIINHDEISISNLKKKKNRKNNQRIHWNRLEYHAIINHGYFRQKIADFHSSPDDEMHFDPQ